MGVHTGTADERDGDYFGPTVNRAARIMAAGHGGQIHVSSATAERCDGRLGAGVELHPLGTHHLKDLEEPEHRLVALTGVGGTGKTRLAVESARRSLDDLPDGAWLVELAPVTNPALIMTAIGDVWGLRPGEGASIEDVVTRYLWAKDLVLVIDNCEHLLDGASAAIRRLLSDCPRLRIVATSRESLGIPGEVTSRVPSLGLPDAAHDLHDAESVRLFLDRAGAVRPGYDPTAEDLASIARICTRIDGIPLGLELAAARLRSMSAVELADRLEDSFRILSGSAKTALPRQRTLQATIDWSHELLKPPERTLFRRISVFTGGFDLAAAEATCAGGDVADGEILDHLDSLVDKSLLVPPHDPDGGTRYRLLEPVRQYAQEQLSASGEAREIRGAHARHYAGFVADASPGCRGPDQVMWLHRITADYDNIRSAFTSLLETGDVDRPLDMTFHLFSFWMHVGMHVEAIETALAGLEAAPETTDPHRLIKAWWVAAGLGAEITRPESVGHARRGLAIAQAMDDPNALGRMELQLGASIRHSTTDPEYLEHLLEGRRLLEANPEPYWWEPVWERGLLNLICAAYLPQEDGRVVEHTETALALFEKVGDQALLAATLGDSAGLLGKVDSDWIMGNLIRSVEIFETLHAPYWHGHALYYLGIFHHLAGSHQDAVRALAEGPATLRTAAMCRAGAGRAGSKPCPRCSSAPSTPHGSGSRR